MMEQIRNWHTYFTKGQTVTILSFVGQEAKSTFYRYFHNKRENKFSQFLFGCTGVLTEGLTLARQLLYHLGHSSSPTKFLLIKLKMQI
jgi:hypothetical protein